MTPDRMLALFGAMFVLALLPGPSVFAVVARSLSSGFTRGLAMAIGIVTGDFLFIIVAISGLAAIAETMASLFIALKYIGGLYLLWLAIQLWRSSLEVEDFERTSEASLLPSFISGLLLTLSDYKAILFYIGFFPAFVDVSAISVLDAFVVMGVAAIAVGGVKAGYAYLAARARTLFKSTNVRLGMNFTAGMVMFGTGLFVLAKR